MSRSALEQFEFGFDPDQTTIEIPAGQGHLFNLFRQAIHAVFAEDHVSDSNKGFPGATHFLLLMVFRIRSRSARVSSSFLMVRPAD